MSQQNLFVPRRGRFHAAFIGLNPSKADALRCDTTTAKLRGFVRRWSGDPNPDRQVEFARDAVLSPCGVYRYRLSRVHLDGDWSFDLFNLFGYRATDPEDLHLAATSGRDVVGPGNDAALLDGIEGATLLVCCWGASGRALAGSRIEEVRRLLDGRELWCFGLTSDGHPKHPRTLGYDAQFARYG